MIDSELDPIIERIAREARRPVAVGSDAKERLLAAVRAEPAPDTAADGVVDAPRRSGVTLSPARFAAMAAGLVGLGALLGTGFGLGRDSQQIGQPQVVAADGTSPRLPAPPSDTMMTFVIVVPNASNVSVVGDFNQWNTTAMPMERLGNNGAWTVTVPIAAGRHLYSFFAVGADGERWIADPNAPAAPDDGFGRANSVVFVGKGSAL